MHPINIQQDLLHCLAELAAQENIKGSIVVVDDGIAESLRWIGGVRVLIRDFGVRNIISWSTMENTQDSSQLKKLLNPFQIHLLMRNNSKLYLNHHVIFMFSNFLWNYEDKLRHLISMDCIKKLTICISLTELAHECYERNDESRKMNFEEFKACLQSALPSEEVEERQTLDEDPNENRLSQNSIEIGFLNNGSEPDLIKMQCSSKCSEATQEQNLKIKKQEIDEDDNWSWEDSAEEENSTNDQKNDLDMENTMAFESEQQENHLMNANVQDPMNQVEDDDQVSGSKSSSFNVNSKSNSIRKRMELNIFHLPLHAATLISQNQNGLPSTFVLTNDICASTFPLMLSKLNRLRLSQSYSSIEEIPPEEIPTTIRKGYKLLAYTLGDILMQLQLKAKEHIFTIGATSLKVGHTLMNILEQLQTEKTIYELKQMQSTSVILIDRTLDLASPSEHSVSLLDRILSILPQIYHTRHESTENQTSKFSKRTHLQFTEIYPIHNITWSKKETEYKTRKNLNSSPFISSIPWYGGCQLAHPMNSQGIELFHSMAGKPAKIALNHILKELRRLILIIEQEMKEKGEKIPNLNSNKKKGLRGRDHVLSRMELIATLSQLHVYQNSSLFQMGLTVLETLERLDLMKENWNELLKLEERHNEMSLKGSTEWILPELADWLKNRVSKGEEIDLLGIFKLVLHAYAISGVNGFDEIISVPLFQDAFIDAMLHLSSEDVEKMKMFSKYLRKDLQRITLSQNEYDMESKKMDSMNSMNMDNKEDDENENWDWEDEITSPRSNLTSPRRKQSIENVPEQEIEHIKNSIRNELVSIFSIFKECGETRKQLNTLSNYQMEDQHTKSLLAQLLNELFQHQPISELHHIVDASAQFTRAGIDLLKSGFSRFGFGSGSSTSSTSTMIHPLNNQILFIFVIGGITFQEIQDVREALEGHNEYQVIIGSTTIVNGDILLDQIFQIHPFE